MRLASMSVLALALGLFVGASAVRAEGDVAPAAATGTVTGKVVDGAGKAVEGATVALKVHVDKPAGKKGVEGGNAKKAKGDGAAGAAAMLSAKTDATGAFSIASVPAGTYDVNAKTTDLKGKAAAPVTVKGGDTVDAGTITLAAAPAKAPK
jgi:hypothetical protein